MTAMLIATRGLPASGKTTWAMERLADAEPGTLVRLNRDDLRVMMHGEGHYVHTTEQQVNLVQHGGIAAILRTGVDVIVDDTNLRARNLKRLADIAWSVGAEFTVQDFTDVPLPVIAYRNVNRPEAERVPADVINSMWRKYLSGRKLPLPVPQRPERVLGEQYVPNMELPPAVMVDIDGTVALHGDRDPFDTSRYHEDTPNWPVVHAVHAMRRAGYALVFCSGRHEDFRTVTEEWLRRHHIVGDGMDWELHMRHRDGRDDVIKLELFDKYIRDRWNVLCVFDDRDRVVRMWRDLGLTVMQVAPGSF